MVLIVDWKTDKCIAITVNVRKISYYKTFFRGFPFLKEINPLHLFTDKKEFLCACNHMLPVASHRQPSVFNCPWKDYLFYCVCFNPRPAGVFSRTRPAGGGADSAPPPCLTPELIGAARRARRRSKALNEKIPMHFKNFLNPISGRGGCFYPPLGFFLNISQTA